MNKACLEFGIRSLTTHDVRGRTVLEVGSRDVNGSLRGHAEGLARLRTSAWILAVAWASTRSAQLIA
jgi:hypothetical protein